MPFMAHCVLLPAIPAMNPSRKCNELRTTSPLFFLALAQCNTQFSQAERIYRNSAFFLFSFGRVLSLALWPARVARALLPFILS